MKRAFTAAGFLIAAALVACGGGGGSPTPTTNPTNTPTTAPATPCPSGYSGTPPNCVYAGPATAQGTLVDHESGAPLAGIAVGLAPWVAGASPVPQPSTAANGTFTVSAPSPGQYLLVIGSNLAADPNNRPTIHDAITLTGGPQTQVLVAPTMPPMYKNYATPPPVEQGGNFRLTTLTSNEQACLAYENQTRAGLGYAPVIPDEWLVENMRLQVQQEINGGGVGGGGVLTNYNGFDGLGCVAMIQNDYSNTSTQYPNMSGATMIWWGGDEVAPNNGGVDEGMYDPRGSLPAWVAGPQILWLQEP